MTLPKYWRCWRDARWDEVSRRVVGLEVIDLEELDRPRI
jgi:cobalamin biosynthesis Mg chelatase CobN